MKKSHLGRGIYADTSENYGNILELNLKGGDVYNGRIKGSQIGLRVGFKTKPGSKKVTMARAIIDTGAKSVCLRDSLCQKAGLKKTGVVNVSGAITSQSASVYEGVLSLFNGAVTIDGVDIFGVPLPGDIDALIGWPIIKLCKLTVWEGKKYTMDFSS